MVRSAFIAMAALAAVSVAHAAPGDDSPSQLHIALDPTATTVVIEWATTAATNCSDVMWGTSPSSLTNKASGTVDNYTLITYHSPTFHVVALPGLTPGQAYSYKAGCAATSTWSAVSTFTLPRSAAQDMAISLALLGDHGHTNDSSTTLMRLQEQMKAPEGPYSALLHAGDISYADGWQPTWDTYMNMIQPLASQLFWQTCPGNHEYVELPIVGVLPNMQAYDVRFRMPRPSSLAAIRDGAPTSVGHDANAAETLQWREGGVDFDTELYWSQDVGPVHVISLNSEVKSFAPNSTQYEWLAADLKAANANRAKVPWVVAMWHRPWESSNHVHGNDTTMRDAWEPTLIEGEVDLVINGHVHAYERSFPMAGGKVVSSGAHGIVYMTVGMGGNGEGLYNNWVTPQPPFSAHRAAVFGHCRLDVANATHARLRMIRNSDGGTEDDAWIVRSASG